MPSVEAICLGDKETITGNYETIEELKLAIVTKFPRHLQKASGDGPVDFILTYHELSDDSQTSNSWFSRSKKSANGASPIPVEKRLDNTDVIKKYCGKTLTIFVKRVSGSARLLT